VGLWAIGEALARSARKGIIQRGHGVASSARGSSGCSSWWFRDACRHPSKLQMPWHHCATPAPPPALLPPQSCAGTNAPLGTTTLYCFPALPIDVLRALSCFAKIRIAQEYRAFLKRYFDKKNFDDCFFVYDRLMAHPVFFVFFIFVVSSVVLCFGWGGCCGFPSAGPRSRPVLNFPGALT